MAGEQTPLARVFAELLEQEGGLAGLIQAFQDKGLSDVIHSWIGTGANLAISAQQVADVLGRERVTQLAEALKLSVAETQRFLADTLPAIIDKLTPDGQVVEVFDLPPRVSSTLREGERR